MSCSFAKWNMRRVFSLRRGDKRRVNFIICGTQKGGTSALNAYLREHPEICMARKKEVHFFDNEEFFRRNHPDYSRYHAYFRPRPFHKLIGEATPIYMYWHDAPRRIWEYNPHMKLIAILRNPIERAYSHWNMQRQKNKEPLSFWDAIHSEQERCRKSLPYQNQRYSYVDRGFYLAQLRRLWRFFPTEQILILKNEDLKNQPDETLRKVYDFLKLKPWVLSEAQKVNVRSYVSPMTERERGYLESVYEYEILSLERVLGWDCRHWLTKT